MRRLVTVLLSLSIPAMYLLAGPKPETELVEALFVNPSYVQAKLSPDGRNLAFITHYQGKRSLVILDLKTNKTRGSTVGPGEDVNHFRWIDNANIVFHVLKWNIYTRGLYVYSLEKMRGRQILDPQESEHIYAGIVDPMLHARGRFILKATQIGSGAPDLYEMDVYSGSLRKLAGNTGHIYHYVVNEDGQPLYALEARGGRTNLLEWNGEGGWRPQESIEERFNPIGMLPGNRYLLVSMGDGRGFRGVNLLDLETGTFPNKPSFYPGYDIPANRASKPIIDNLNGYFVGIRFHHEKPENMWFISGPDRVEQLLKRQFEGFDCEFLGFNPEDKLIYFTISKDTHPPVIIQLDIGTGKPSAVHHQFPDLIGMEFRPVKPVSFKHDNASFPIHGYLTLPEGPGPYPTVLLVHGGPRTRDTWGFEPKVQLLALNGYAVLQVNYRGSSGYGRRYGLRSLSDTAEKSVDDVIAGARWLVAEGIADPDRLAVMGGSFGGFISLEAAARAPDLWQAVIGYAGLYDLNAIHKQDDRRGYLWVDDMYADFDEERYAALSPVNHAGSIKAPVLIVHGKSDRRIGLAQAKDMVRALKKSGNEVESMYIRWGVHGLPEEKDRKKYFNKILSWLEQHLK